MLFKLVETIQFPATDCEDVAEMVSIIVNSLHKCHVVKDGDRVHFTTENFVVTIHIYRPQEGNGHG